MTEERFIVTDQPGAQAINRLIDESLQAGVGTGKPVSIPEGQSIVVRLQTAIESGSLDSVAADVMELQGGSWQTTGAVVQVRSLTGQAVSTTGRRIARRIGRHGWGVVET